MFLISDWTTRRCTPIHIGTGSEKVGRYTRSTKLGNSFISPTVCTRALTHTRAYARTRAHTLASTRAHPKNKTKKLTNYVCPSKRAGSRVTTTTAKPNCRALIHSYGINPFPSFSFPLPEYDTTNRGTRGMSLWDHGECTARAVTQYPNQFTVRNNSSKRTRENEETNLKKKGKNTEKMERMLFQ